MAKFRFYGMIDVEIEAEDYEEARVEFEDGLEDIVLSCIDYEVIEED